VRIICLVHLFFLTNPGRHFLQQFTQLHGRGISLDQAALDAVLAYFFTDNIRELSHILESAVAVSTENPQMIKERDFSTHE
jgi:transcriptional regulator with PAS, ATPase and Fis domain